jgi:hypothetical protein
MTPIHPMLIAYSSGKTVEYSQWAIDREVERGFKMIYKRLEAERELDRIESLWYNKEKRGPDGQETNNAD